MLIDQASCQQVQMEHQTLLPLVWGKVLAESPALPLMAWHRGCRVLCCWQLVVVLTLFVVLRLFVVLQLFAVLWLSLVLQVIVAGLPQECHFVAVEEVLALTHEVLRLAWALELHVVEWLAKNLLRDVLGLQAVSWECVALAGEVAVARMTGPAKTNTHRICQSMQLAHKQSCNEDARPDTPHAYVHACGVYVHACRGVCACQ